MSSSKDYDARMIEVWRQAALQPEGVKIPFLDEENNPDEAYKKAVVQRHRFYRLRSALEKEKHPVANHAAQCKISILITLKNGKEIKPYNKKTWEDSDVKAVDLWFTSHAADKTMDKALSNAGFKVPEAPDLG